MLEIVSLISIPTSILLFVFVISLNRRLSNQQKTYECIFLEKVKLTERCSYLSDIEKKYEDSIQKCKELEKDRIVLSSKLEQERKSFCEKINLLENAERKLTDTFNLLSSEALSKNNQSFINIAKSFFEQQQEKVKSDLAFGTKSMNDLVNPIKSALDGVGGKLDELEKNRISAYESLKQQVKDLIETQNSLKNETTNLSSILKNPAMRGLWGEMQLKRVVEISGMVKHCDFNEQVYIHSDGTNIRPDMVIYFPGNKRIIVDSKAPLTAYLDAFNTKEEKLQKEFLKKHALSLKNHIKELSNKKYWNHVVDSPEFVVMFLPGESFLSVALENDPTLLEEAMQRNIIIATPMTLIALLRTISLGWSHSNLEENAKQIVLLGKELYKRLIDVSEHISNLGKSINSTVSSYNKTVSSLESRFFVTARRFKEIQNVDKDITNITTITNNAKSLNYNE